MLHVFIRERGSGIGGALVPPSQDEVFLIRLTSFSSLRPSYHS
jgi:hypothetical protein